MRTAGCQSLGAKRTSISACDRLDYEYGSYTIKSLFSIPNITPPQLLPTYSYWFEMCCRPAVRSARMPPNGRFLREAGGGGHLEDARGERRAALGHHGRSDFCLLRGRPSEIAALCPNALSALGIF